MKLYVYSVRDKKLGAFGSPSYSKEDKEHTGESVARGLMKGEAKDIPEARDLALYYLGTYDDITGHFELVPEPEKILDYEDYLRVEVCPEVKKVQK